MAASIDTIERTPFQEHRPYLFAIAYRMLGSASEAEDVVQDAYLRMIDAAPAEIASVRAYLSTIVTRLCLDELKSARRQRERAGYPGLWYPEPVPTADLVPSPEAAAEQRESISLALLALLEHLTPEQRAVYVLREAFDFDYAEIAAILDKSVAATRQLGHRARKLVSEDRPRFTATPADHRRLTERFLGAITTGDLPGLIELLAPDVTLWGDGGLKVQARRRPIEGVVEVGRFLGALMQLAPPETRATVEEINGEPAMVVWIGDAILEVMTFEAREDGIASIRAVINPDKLVYLQRRIGLPGTEPSGWPLGQR